MRNTQKFFAESAYYDPNDPLAKQKAKDYLEFWKKNLIFKLKRDSFDIKIIEEQLVERSPEYVSCLAQYATIALKLCLEADFYYEL